MFGYFAKIDLPQGLKFLHDIKDMIEFESVKEVITPPFEKKFTRDGCEIIPNDYHFTITLPKTDEKLKYLKDWYDHQNPTTKRNISQGYPYYYKPLQTLMYHYVFDYHHKN